MAKTVSLSSISISDISIWKHYEFINSDGDHYVPDANFALKGGDFYVKSLGYVRTHTSLAFQCNFDILDTEGIVRKKQTYFGVTSTAITPDEGECGPADQDAGSALGGARRLSSTMETLVNNYWTTMNAAMLAREDI